jgi:hypothetical protein
MVELSNGDFTCGLRRPLAAEIDKRPLLTSKKTPITSVRYTVDKKHVLNTNRKPWSTNRLVALIPVRDVIWHLSHVTLLIVSKKHVNSSKMVRDTHKVSTEH